jgi:hypothetical protein
LSVEKIVFLASVLFLVQEENFQPGIVLYACNSSYSGGKKQEDPDSSPARPS